MRLALYQLEIAQNVGTLLRLAACLGIPVDIIEPLGFPWDSRKLQRAGLDYAATVPIHKYAHFEDFHRQKTGRVVLLDTKASLSFLDFPYKKSDILLVGRESCGVPDSVFLRCESTVKIPMIPGMRSLNVAVAAAIGLSEALRQTGLFPE
jgi:tRNA (cytidine/uridine-2'-O-)-methyltransferase